MATEFKGFDDFWPFYLRQHSKPATRRWHFVSTGLGTCMILAAFLTQRWLLLLAAPLVGYGLAWYSHFFIEGNKPATFGHPFWSFMCDYKMFAFILTGRMDAEIERLKKTGRWPLKQAKTTRLQ